MTTRHPIAHRFKPPEKLQVSGYDFDAFTVEEDEHGDFDFRLELGEGNNVYWAIPAGGFGGHLRLFHVSATWAYELEEPSLEQDPFVGELARVTFEGDGKPIKSVSIELHANPQSYSCVLVLANRAPVELRYPAES
ncbi:MAG: hypothetical protein JNM17_40440 [Archangium sp.]|nr:hypothetical protein [Archangium sp.]